MFCLHRRDRASLKHDKMLKKCAKDLQNCRKITFCFQQLRKNGKFAVEFGKMVYHKIATQENRHE